MSFIPSQTVYPLPNGGTTDNYHAFRDAQAEHAAAQARFNGAFGATLATPEGRRAAADALRAGAAQPMSVTVAPAAPKFQGGLSEAEVERRVEVASTGVTNRHGAEVFAVPSSAPQAVVEADLPPGATRINFFGGKPQT